MPSKQPHPEKPTTEKSNGPIKLVLFFDGTSNTFHGTKADTNVVKLLRKLERDHPNQYHYYQTGIGTYEVYEPSINQSVLGEIKSFCSKALDQALGSTFDAHVMAGYKFIMRYYEKDAKIYIFGFSRGAYTAKFLAQMINTVGLLCKGNEEMVPFAYRLFQHYIQGEIKLRKKKIKKHGGKVAEQVITTPDDSEDEEPSQQNGSRPNESHDSSDRRRLVVNDDHFGHIAGKLNEKDEEEHIRAARREIRAFSKAFCRKDRVPPNKRHNAKNVRVHFLGLWDCVASIAVLERHAKAPIPIFGTAEHVRHAVAIDEHRVKFRPWLLSQDICLVAKSKKDNDTSQDTQYAKQAAAFIEGEDIREVWFPGSHCDVGGGRTTENVITKDGRMVTWFKKFFGLLSGKKESGHSGQIQLSDVALAWMIDELHVIDGLVDPKPGERQQNDSVRPLADDMEYRQNKSDYEGLHWHKRHLWEFKEKFSEWNAERNCAERGGANLEPMHHPLKFNHGTPFVGVLFWKFLEYMPFIHRWELNSNKWYSCWLWPNLYHPRDIPPKAVIHDSAYRRLERDKQYNPKNTHGKRGGAVESPESCINLEVQKEEHEWSREDHKLWTFT